MKILKSKNLLLLLLLLRRRSRLEAYGAVQIELMVNTVLTLYAITLTQYKIVTLLKNKPTIYFLQKIKMILGFLSFIL